MASYGSTDGTGWRAKQDDSSTFVWAQTLTAPCQLFVDGQTVDVYGNVVSGPENCTVNDRAYLDYVGSFLIYQNVYEWGHNQARLTSWGSNGASYTDGYWSPDSYGDYPVINRGFIHQ